MDSLKTPPTNVSVIEVTLLVDCVKFKVYAQRRILEVALAILLT